MKVKWTIGILTVPPRAKQLRELLDVLEPQIAEAKGKIQAVVLYNNFEKTLGELRQHIVDEAKGDYVSFIDDDDMVPDDFCQTILPHLNGKNDYIGFRVAFYHNGRKMPQVIHSLRYDDWHQTDRGYFRDISHLNPIKTDIARQASFKGMLGEDMDWANQLRGKLKKEHFIDREMYEYRHSTTDSYANGPHASDRPRDIEFNHKEIIGE